jgi:hypothetical protein
MSDEQRRVLDLLAQGKITVDGADSLLRALAAQQGSEPDAAPTAGSDRDEADVMLHDKPARKWRGMFGFGAVKVPLTERPGARYLKIEVHKPAADGREQKNVNIRVPIALVRGGMRLGTIIGFYADDKVQQRLRERGIDLDLSKLDTADLDNLLNNVGEMTVNVDNGKSQVRISCE